MIIVEGPDGAGKSTLVDFLCTTYSLCQGVRGTTNRDLLWTVTVPDTMRALSIAVRGMEGCKVWDRLYYSDFVYAPMMEREVAFNAAQQMHIDRVIEALRPPIIVCLPSFEYVERNAGDKHQMKGVNDNLRTIYNDYHAMCYRVGDAIKAFPEHRIVYDYTRDSMSEVSHEIEDYLDHRLERQP